MFILTPVTSHRLFPEVTSSGVPTYVKYVAVISFLLLVIVHNVRIYAHSNTTSASMIIIIQVNDLH